VIKEGAEIIEISAPFFGEAGSRGTVLLLPSRDEGSGRTVPLLYFPFWVNISFFVHMLKYEE